MERAPNAVSEARWAEALLYSPKMQKYASLMGYSTSYVSLLQRFNAWSILYVPYWFQAANAPDVQVIDLEFFRLMDSFRQVDEEIASAVLTTWFRHTDYLSPEFCFLSLTSDRVSSVEKQRIASAI